MGILKHYIGPGVGVDDRTIKLVNNLTYVKKETYCDEYTSQAIKIWRALERRMGIDIDIRTVNIAYNSAIAQLEVVREIICMLSSWISSNNSTISDEDRESLSYNRDRIYMCYSNFLTLDSSTLNRVLGHHTHFAINRYVTGSWNEVDMDEFMRVSDDAYAALSDVKECIRTTVNSHELARYVSIQAEFITTKMYQCVYGNIEKGYVSAIIECSKICDNPYEALRANIVGVGRNKQHDWDLLENEIASLYSLGYSLSAAQYIFLKTLPTKV